MSESRWEMLIGIILILIQLFAIWRLWDVPKTNNRMLPILTPVSLKYEQLGRQGNDPLNVQRLIQDIDAIEFNDDPRAQIRLKSLISGRERMLILRDQRHKLNVNLMNHGISLIEVLTEEQWQWVQSHRDTVKADREQEQVDKILQRWGVTF